MPASKLRPSWRPRSKNSSNSSQIAFRHRPAIRATGDILDRIVRGAVTLGGLSARLTHENRATTRRVLHGAGDLVWASDLYRADVRVSHIRVVVGDRPSTLRWIRKAFGLPELADERHAHCVGPGVGVDADLEPGIAGDLHVFLPFGIAGKARLAVAGIAQGRRTPLRIAADGEPLHQLAVHAHVELLRPSHSLQVILVLALQADLDEILPVHGEVVGNGDTASRSERQILALPIVLKHVNRDLERFDARARRRQPGCRTRHLPGD